MDGCWKTGSLVRLNALDRTFRGVGQDSVGFDYLRASCWRIEFAYLRVAGFVD
jgi:hypothetical protein